MSTRMNVAGLSFSPLRYWGGLYPNELPRQIITEF